jgi:preprotein translocase subunit SecE
MNSNVESPQATLDTVKLAVALVLMMAGLGAFYVFADVSRLYRVLGLLAAVGVAIAIAAQTTRGRALIGFAGDVQVEVRKVVWPTRQETLQTTLAVFVVVFIAAIILWLLDMLLAVLIRWLMG